MAFNTKLAQALVAQRPQHVPQLSEMDLEAERQGTAIRRSSKPTFLGKRLLNRTPSRQMLRA